MSKVLCVIPPDFVYSGVSNTPTGIMMIHKLLKDSGHESLILDLRGCKTNGAVDFEVSHRLLIEDIPIDYVFLSGCSCHMDVLGDIAYYVKLLDRGHTKTVLGGPHVNSVMLSGKWKNSVFSNKALKEFDHIVSGYVWNIDSIRVLMSAIADNSKINLINLTSNIASPQYVSDIPYEDIDENSVSKTGGVLRDNEGELVTQNIMMTYGCPYSCTFCANPSRKYHKFNVSDIVKDIRRRIDKYQITGLKIDDDDVMIDLDWCDALLDEIAENNINLKYLISTRCNVKVGSKKLELIKRFNKLGLSVIGLGVEWYSNHLLSSMNKGITTGDIDETIKCISGETDAKIHVYSIFGLPNMNWTDVLSHIGFIQRSKDIISSMSMTNFVPVIGTEPYENPDKFDGRTYVRAPNNRLPWSNFYFVSDFAKFRFIPNEYTVAELIDMKLAVCRELRDAGFLRRETMEDIEKAGYKL